MPRMFALGFAVVDSLTVRRCAWTSTAGFLCHLASGCAQSAEIGTGGASSGESTGLLSGETVGQYEATDSFPQEMNAPRPPQPIVEGFALEISKPDDQTVLVSWADLGATNYEVWTSTDPYFAPGDTGSSQVASGPTTSFSTASGTEAYYRVVAPGAAVELSTTVGQISYDLYAGYTKLGVCMVSEVDHWPELQEDMPSGPADAFMWDEQTQGWVQGNAIADVALGPGEVISVLHGSAPSPDSYTWVGLVPTSQDVSIALLPGDNLVTTVPLRFGPLMASELLAQVESAVRIGSWNPATQTLAWHPDDGDWLLPTCSPIHVEVSAPSNWPPPGPDPSDVAPPLDTTVTTGFFDAVRFLFEGSPRVQEGVLPGTIEPTRVAVLRGSVTQRDGGALSNVRVEVLGHPEYGSTRTRADGRYDIAVNGGTSVVLSFSFDEMLPSQRTVDAPWQDYVEVPEVALVELDSEVSTIDFSAPIGVHVSSLFEDNAGERGSTLMFRQGTTATMVLPDASEVVLPSVSVRATEYTVGPNGPSAMPGDLPPTSAYTYAVEYSIDEARAAGADRVEFDPPAISYTTNFLHFPVGSPVPVGSYDRRRALWVPENSGVVLELVSETAGFADIDVTGDGAADPLLYASVGISDDERATLAELHDPGDELWRVAVAHFSPWDCNWPWGPPSGSEFPPADWPLDPSSEEDPCTTSGSILECENQVLGETVPVAGTSFSLNYRSDRVPGRLAAYTIAYDATSLGVPPDLSRVDVSLDVAGRHIHQEVPGLPNQGIAITWDGLDAYGRRVQGPSPARFCVGYVYPGSYNAPRPPGLFGDVGSGVDISADAGRFEATLRRCYAREIVGGGARGSQAASAIGTAAASATYNLGVWDARAAAPALGGWTLSVHHTLAPETGVLYLGTGEHQAHALAGIDTVAGGGASTSDGVPAVSAQLSSPLDIAALPDGSVLIIDGSRVRRVGSDGIITTFAGTGVGGFSGDGGPAVAAQLSLSVLGLSVGPDGSVYIADFGNRRVRRVAIDGTISTIAGNGVNASAGDGGPATSASLRDVSHAVAGPDGSIYVREAGVAVAHRIRRVAPDGVITTFAGGTCTAGPPAGKVALGDCFFGIDNALASSGRLAVGKDGSVYAPLRESSTSTTYVVDRITPSGRFERFAGGGTPADGLGDGLVAIDARLSRPTAVALSPTGDLFIGERGGSAGTATENHTRVRVVQNGIIRTVAGTGSGDASQPLGDLGPATDAPVINVSGLAFGRDNALYISTGQSTPALGSRVRRVSASGAGFSESGNHTILGANGNEVYLFDSTGRHLTTRDAITGALVFAFEYDDEGRLATITDRFGAVTTIERSGTGIATGIVSPDGLETQLSFSTEGWLAAVTNPAAETHSFEYSPDGLLISFAAPGGGEATYGYDALGRLVLAQDPAGGSKTLARTEPSQGEYEVSITTSMGRVTTYRRTRMSDGAGRRTVSTPDGGEIETLQASNGATTVTSANGEVTRVAVTGDPRFGMQAPARREVRVTTPGGLELAQLETRVATLADPIDPLSMIAFERTINVNGREWHWSWNANSAAMQIVSPMGRTTEFTLDSNSQPYLIALAARPFGSSVIGYDGRGRAQSVTLGAGAAARVYGMSWDADGFLESLTDPLSRSTAFARDQVGRVIQEMPPGSTATALEYDDDGNLEVIVPPSGASHGFTYDLAQRLTSYDPPAVPSSPQPSTQIDYNLDQQIDLVALPDGTTIDFAYSAASGRLTSLNTALGSYVLTYDAVGRVDGMSEPGGSELTYAYDGSLVTSELFSGPISGGVQWAYDDDLRVETESVNGSYAVTFEYDDDGLRTGAGTETILRHADTGLVETASLNGALLELDYNEFAELTSLDYDVGGFVYSSVYERDGLGRIVEATEVIDGGSPRVVEYGYDLAGRLESVTEDSVVVAAFGYDANGNRESVETSSGTVVATFDAQDRLLSLGTTAFSHTDNGEVSERLDTVSNESTTYEFDVFGNLREVQLADGTVIDYVVDARNRRVARRVDGVLERGWIYGSQLEPVAEVDGAGALSTRFVYGVLEHTPDYMVRGTTTYRLITDHLGSVRFVVDTATGAVAQRIDYGAFGEVLLDTNPGFQPFGFAGGLYDAGTGLVRFGAREYDPSSGRWMARDPAWFVDGTNLYVYVGNDPINSIDVDGHAWAAAAAAWCVAVPGCAQAVAWGATAAAAAAASAAAWACWESGLCQVNRWEWSEPQSCPRLGDWTQSFARARPRLVPLGQRPKTPECDAEWEAAEADCVGYIRTGSPLAGGHKNLLDCARGHVSAHCGGNSV